MGVWFAGAQVVLSAGAAVGYALARDWPRCVYWLCATGLTATVTWWME
jgi:hypothetical protein